MNKHGELVGFERFRNPKIHIDQVRQGMIDNHLPVDLVLDLTPRMAFTRACALMKENRQIDKLKQKGGWYQFQMTARAFAGDRLDFTFEAMVNLDGSSGAIVCDDKYIEKRAQQLFSDAMQHRTPQDITKIIQKTLTTHAEMWPFLIEKGCVYFVPDKFKSVVDCVEGFVHQMGGTFRRSPVPRGDKHGDQTAKEACTGYMLGLIAELREVVKGFDASTTGDRLLRTAERYQQIKFKMDAYREYVNTTAEQELSAATKELIETSKRVEELKEAEKGKLAQAS
jgi:hypothetical protein